MANRKKTGGIVYRTGEGRICPGCLRAINECVCADRSRPPSGNQGDGIVRIQREVKGRKGAGVTVVTGLPLSDTALTALAKVLKKKCGVGGSVKNGNIELQGDQRERVKSELESDGYKVKLAGG